jgi:hypothetical protein
MASASSLEVYMIEFFITPVFFLTPWIMLWALLTGMLAALAAIITIVTDTFCF